MKKFLVGFGAFLIIAGGVGIIQHYSLVFQTFKDEQEMYSGQSLSMVLMQSTYGLDPYIKCIISGGAFIAFSLFLSEFRNRNQLTLELIQKISNAPHSDSEVIVARETNQEEFKAPQESKEDQYTSSVDEEKDGRFYWKG
ncbi:hypothetical protein ACFFIX_17410 [Metabacillus herbersteinensis]|uniref:Uncharacterized protein n=1 Tax=Metabacillus herbersteinensis TaxID=283816 RepID=A0ABV6GHN9_9BACI